MMNQIYKKTSNFIRKDNLLNEKVCIIKKQLMILEYYIRLRWRAHINTYLHKSIVSSGTSVSKLEAIEFITRKVNL